MSERVAANGVHNSMGCMIGEGVGTLWVLLELLEPSELLVLGLSRSRRDVIKITDTYSLTSTFYRESMENDISVARFTSTTRQRLRDKLGCACRYSHLLLQRRKLLCSVRWQEAEA